MKKIFLFTIIVAVAFIFVSCDKEKNNEKKSNNKSVSIDMMKLPVYYNGVEMNCLMEDFKKPASKGGDMEEVSLVFEDAIHIFDEDAAFYDFCLEEEMMDIYGTNQKLDLIYAKAEVLGLTEIEDEVGYDEIPIEMHQYWSQVFSTSIPEADRNLAGRLFSGQNCTQDSKGFIPVFYPSFGDFNNKARSFEICGILSHGWMCTKKWFGGPRMWYFCPLGIKKYNSLSATYDQKICSTFGF